MNSISHRSNVFIRLLSVIAMLLTMVATAAPAAAAPNDPVGYFSETGYRVGDAKFWEYFQARGGIRTFGYPVSRVFILDGFKVQIFQRRVLQLGANGNVAQLNLLDPQFMPYTSLNYATIPAQDNELLKSAPAPGAANYARGILDYVKANAPDQINDLKTNYTQTFQASVTMADAFPQGGGNTGLLSGFQLEMWGAPTSRPAADPNNSNFVFLRFQRGIMHFDKTTGTTQGVLLGDYFKSILTGQNLPPDLAKAAITNPFLARYDNSQAVGISIARPLANANLKNAFEPEPPAAAPGAEGIPVATVPVGPAPSNLGGGPLRYGWQVHAFGQDTGRIVSAVKNSGFGWMKQQVRWSTHKDSDLDQAVNAAASGGLKLMVSVVTAPARLTGGRGENSPPDDPKAFGAFVGALASKYKGRIHAYELWNEQNYAFEWKGRRLNGCDYIPLLREGYNAIKAVDPNAIVVSGAMTPTGVNDDAIAIDDKAYLEQMYTCNNGEFLRIADAVGYHATGFNNGPDDGPGKSSVNTPGFKGHWSFYFNRIDDLYQVNKKYNDPRPVWITEFHWGAAPPPIPDGYEWATHLTEQQAGDFIAQALATTKATRPWVGAAFIWNLNFRTFQNFRTSETAIFGALNEDWTPRAIFRAVRDLPK